MDDNLSTLSTTPLEMEIIHSEQEGKTLSFRTAEGYFSLTDSTDAPAGGTSHYYEVTETSYEDDSLSLYFDSETRFQDIYDVVTFNWRVDGEIAGFLAENLITGNTLHLALNADGRKRLQ